MRARSLLARSTVVLLAATVALWPAAPAAAASLPLERCYDQETPQYADAQSWSAPGNRHTVWPDPEGILDRDVFQVSAHGRIRIDHWGTQKSVAGELPPAGSDWPAPGAPRYALIAKVTAGTMLVLDSGLSYGPGRWFPVGTDSGCMLYFHAGLAPQLIFSFNDPNLGDNGGGASVLVRQWWD
ncbi:hypothetical protein ACGFIG_28150 [Micromonospora sp. NPDC049048]|uniref:hypothetical protein n=1 Tax=Micromonospora sp. NPDC049048 TaxID=3364263 RepID=UPI0037174934